MKRLVSAAFLLFAGVAHAEYFETGNDFSGICTDKFPGHDHLCLGMSAAYFDMMLASGYQCAATGIAREQVRDTLLKYLSDNPDQRNQPASQLALTAWKGAFQCAVPVPPPVTRPTASKAQSGKAKGPVVLTPIH
jgi:Rap1a immunity proteins